ncbi:kelch-like protein 26 [Haliotis rufescens]|uniref:kelch-like protein 26 n=1 Tax=Haliotis rufescens TaxID=6454 RepID=UPI001EAFC6F7|nr:kelch-like protein 26 [Haliotis rufescens]
MDVLDQDQFQFEATNHGDVLLAGLRHLRDKHQLFDVTLVVDKLELPAHRVVLASCSDYFRAMFTDGLKECRQKRIVLNGVTARGMKNLLDFAYTSKSNIDSDNVADVLGAATHVQILPVIDACEDFLRSHLSLDNCVDVASVADLYCLQPLQQHVQQYICKHWTTFTMSTYFHSMGQQALVNVLASGFPVNCSELEVLLAVLSWVKYSPEERLTMAENILAHVQFHNISEESLKDMLEKKEWKDMMLAVPCLEKMNTRFQKEARNHRLDICDGTLGHNVSREVHGITNMRGFHETVLVAGGFSADSGMTNNIWYYEEEKDLASLKYLTRIPHVDQCNFGMAVLHNQLYVIGGCFNDQFDEVIHPYGFRYDPSKSEWDSITPMNHERCRFYLGVTEGYLYAIGGDPQASDLTLDGAPCERYDPKSNSWQDIEPVPGNRTQHAGVAAGQFLYVSGGQQETDGEILNDLLRYDTHSNTWERCASLRSPRVDHTMFFFNGQVYIIGGWTYDQTNHQREMVSSIDCYHSDTDSWQQVATLNETRLYATYTLFDSVIYVIGGWQGGDYRFKSRFVDCLDLKTRQWKDKKNQSLEMWEHNSCSLYLPKLVKP